MSVANVTPITSIWLEKGTWQARGPLGDNVAVILAHIFTEPWPKKITR